MQLIIFCTENDTRPITHDELMTLGLELRQKNANADNKKRVRLYINHLKFIGLIQETEPHVYQVNQAFSLSELL